MAEWRQIPRWPNYEVSSDGRVRNRFSKELYIDRDRVGYLRVKLYRNGKAKNRRIHVLMAQAFLNWKPGCDVDHMDNDRTNNVLSNLEVVSHQENCIRMRQRQAAMAQEEEPAPF